VNARWGTLPIAMLVAIAGSACSEDEPAPSASEAAITACTNAPDEAPDDLACTGLYDSFAEKRIAKDVRTFAPAVPLWSDGFEKERFILLPEGQTIDAANADEWKFPVGTKAWKEFRSGTRKIETRLLWKVREDRWIASTYVWSADGLTAQRHSGGSIDVDGRPYDVPKTTQCNECHKGRKDRLLGFEAISLGQPGASGLTLETLAAENRLEPPPARTQRRVPPALAYLHVNCGVSCHNASSSATAYATGLRFRLGLSELTGKPMSTWEIVKTSLGVPARTPEWSEEPRIVAGDPDASLVVRLMKQRGDGQMPPLGTTKVDDAAVQAVSSWIASLEPARGSTEAKPKKKIRIATAP
jgi:hypothetical protein